jgi:hypothetical protein
MLLSTTLIGLTVPSPVLPIGRVPGPALNPGAMASPDAAAPST